MTRGLGTGGVWGGRTPPRIRDLCSKIFFENFSYLFGPPLDKNRSQAPDHNYLDFSSRLAKYETLRWDNMKCRLDFMLLLLIVYFENGVSYTLKTSDGKFSLTI